MVGSPLRLGTFSLSLAGLGAASRQRTAQATGSRWRPASRWLAWALLVGNGRRKQRDHGGVQPLAGWPGRC
ncbi:MAG: hypothetical protein EOM24_29280 [Chloroflexia bacterium]|nr:hypothetical protein [Chloroflexia bacterium]